MGWIFLVRAAFATLAGLSHAVIPLFHGGAGNTATKVSSALDVVNAFAQGTADQLLPADVHPELVIHAAEIADAHAAETLAATTAAATVDAPIGTVHS